MQKSCNKYPLNYFTLTLGKIEPIHRLKKSKKFYFQRSLDTSFKFQEKKSRKDLKILITSYKSSNQANTLKLQKKKLKIIENNSGSKSVIQVCESSLSPRPKPIVINSVLKNVPLRVYHRPMSAVTNHSRKKEETGNMSRWAIRKMSNNSQISVVDEFFEKKTKNFGTNINS